MFVHLRALQDIANANKGNRAEGTPGYDASVEYVAKALRSKGFEVATPQFERLYAERLPFYRQATLCLETSGKKPVAICLEIEAALELSGKNASRRTETGGSR